MSGLTFEKAVNIILNQCREEGKKKVTAATASFILETTINPGIFSLTPRH